MLLISACSQVTSLAQFIEVRYLILDHGHIDEPWSLLESNCSV